MITIRDHKGKLYYINPEHVSVLTQSTVADYLTDDDTLYATEVWFEGCYLTIDLPLDEVVSALKPRVRG